MKSFFLSALIALSLGLNVLVLVALTSPATVAPLARLIHPDADTSTPAAASPAARTRATPGTTAAIQHAAQWANLRSDDPATFVANLRAAGFSDAEIRALLSSQLNQKVNARRRELAAPAQNFPYWRVPTGPTGSGAVTNPEGLAELREMSRQNTRLLDSLLGPAPAFTLVNPTERLQFADLPPDKVDQLRLINADYSDLINAVRSHANGALFPEDRATLKLLNDGKDQDIRALLTPDEYDNYQLRSSNTATNLRNNLQLFQPTEEEFRRIFAIQFPFDQQYNMDGGIDMDLLRQRSLAQADLTAQIKAALSPERLADYEKTTDSSYRQAVALTARLELPPESATQLWSLQKDAQQRMTTLRSDRTLAADARTQALTALQQELTARATGVLGGPRGFDAYKTNGGQWLQNLVPQPVPAVPPPPAR